MAVDQRRLITIVNAARLSLDAVNLIRARLRSLSLYLESGSMKYDQAFAELALFIESNDALYPETPAFAPDLSASTYIKVLTTITNELNHFRRNARYNERQAILQRLRRDRTNPNRKRRRSEPHSIHESSSIVPLPNRTSSIPDFDPETQAAWERDNARARTQSASHPPFEIQTPNQEPTDYSAELHPSPIKPTWTTPLDPHGDEEFSDEPDPNNQLPPSGRQ